MSRPIGLRPVQSPPVITLGSRCALGSEIARTASGAPASGVAAFAAGDLLAFPFVIEATTTFYKGFWMNGSAAASNDEVGIWDVDYNKIVTTGSVGATGNNVPQVAAFARDDDVAARPVYAGLACDSATNGRHFRWSVATTGIAFWQAAGCWLQASNTLGSLAATATPADITNVGFPVFGLLTRNSFDM